MLKTTSFWPILYQLVLLLTKSGQGGMQGERWPVCQWTVFSSYCTVIHNHCICAYNHTVHTECIITPCTECQQPFRTYVPDTICRLPDGGSVFYREAQTQCPLCDSSGFGTFWNMDLFPELQPRGVAIPKSDAGDQLMRYTLSLHLLTFLLSQLIISRAKLVF